MIIGINGKIGSGKDTLTGIIKGLDNQFVQKSYAYKLKQIVALLTSTTIEENLTQEGKQKYIKEFDMTLGQMQQVIGTNVMRNSFDENVWVKSLFTGYSDKQKWIISDVRFPNEADYIKSLGGILIRLEGDPAKVRENSNRDIHHISETALDDYNGFDLFYRNDKSLDELKDFAKVVLNKISIFI